MMPKPKKNPLPPRDWGKQTPGERLARIRKGRGLTQSKVGKILGITQNMVSDYEVGRSRLNDEMLARFSEVLNVSVDKILGLQASPDLNETLQLRYVKRVVKAQSLEEKEQKHILKTLDSLIHSATTRAST